MAKNKNFKRYTIEFPNKIMDIIEKIAEKNHISKAEVLRRAIALYSFIDKEVIEEENRALIIKENNEEVKEIVLTG